MSTPAEILASSTQFKTARARTISLDAASAVLQRLNLQSSNTVVGSTFEQLSAQDVFVQDGQLIIVNQAGQQYVVGNQDQVFFNQRQLERTLQASEQDNELQAYQFWAQEQGVDQPGVTDTLVDFDDLQRQANYGNFQDFVTAVLFSTGRKPYATPYADYLDQQTLDLLAEQNDPSTRYGSASAEDVLSDSATLAGSAALASDEYAALRSALDTSAAQQEVEQSRGGLLPFFPGNRPRSAAAAQGLAGSLSFEDQISVAPQSADIQTETISVNPLRPDDGTRADIPATTIEFGQTRGPRVRDNPLDQHDSSSYTISLHLLTKDEYNSLVTNERSFVPQNTLIAGAGASTPDSGRRAQEFNENFFFESLKLSAVTALNANSRGTNVIELDFVILEPMGLTLIDRLIVTTSRVSADVQYFANAYALEINFFTPDQKLQALKKFIPIRLTGLEVKTSARGSSYSCTAVPFAHHAFSQSTASTPINLEVTAGTLIDFFGSQDNATASGTSQGVSDALADRELQSLALGIVPNDNTVLGRIANQQKQHLADKFYTVNSYVQAYNEWHKSLVTRKFKDVTEPNTISVQFDPSFVSGDNGKLVRPITEVAQAGASPMATDNATSGQRSLQQVTRFAFAAGTQVTEVINLAMRQSQYIRTQIQLQDLPQSQSPKPVNWWKIIPSIKLKQFDTKSNNWTFDTVYTVVPYKLYNTTFPYLPRQIPTRELAVKEYLFYYTGENSQVLDFAIQFDYLYFTKITTLRDTNIDNEQRARVQGDNEQNATANGGPNAGITTHVAPSTKGALDNKDPTAVAVADAAQSIYSSAGGEMLNIQLKVIGDPDLIKTDSPGDASSSVNMDLGDVISYVEIRSPTDINDKTGGVNYFQNTKKAGSFSGVYKILMTESEFSKGLFTQTIDMIRYANQDRTRGTAKPQIDPRIS